MKLCISVFPIEPLNGFSQQEVLNLPLKHSDNQTATQIKRMLILAKAKVAKN